MYDVQLKVYKNKNGKSAVLTKSTLSSALPTHSNSEIIEKVPATHSINIL